MTPEVLTVRRVSFAALGYSKRIYKRLRKREAIGLGERSARAAAHATVTG